MRYQRSNTNIFNVGYHLIWCSKYRRKVLNDRIKIRLKIKAKQINVSIEKMEVMPDHIHLFLKASPILSPHKIAWQFKGYTSRLLREEFKTLRSRLPTLCTSFVQDKK